MASGPEHTGVFVQALLRIVANLRFFILILVVLVLTFSFAFWQVRLPYPAFKAGRWEAGGGAVPWIAVRRV